MTKDGMGDEKIEDVHGQLRESEELNRIILESSADCIKVLDLDSRLLFMSKGALGAMEVDDFRAVEGCPWPSFWPDDGGRREMRATAMHDAMASDRAYGRLSSVRP